MHQKCNLPEKPEEELHQLKGTSCWSRFRRKYMSLVLVSSKNPLTSLYFKSETAIKEEKMRQLSSGHPYIIHPLSIFRVAYDVWLTFMYLMMLTTKPIDAATSFRETKYMPQMVTVSLLVDLLSWSIIIATFFMGYIKNQTKSVVMSPKQIARNYVFSIFFIVDLTSSWPRWGLSFMFGDLTGTKLNKLTGYIIIFNHLKLLRLVTVLQNIHKLSQYLNIKSKGKVFWLSTFVLMLVTIHWAACMQLAVPRITRDYLTNDYDHYKSWLTEFSLQGKSFGRKYVHAFFKSSAILLGIRINLYQMLGREDYIVVIMTYIIGKIIICAAWIVMMISLLHSRRMEIKLFEIMNQLDAYMRQKQLPMNLREKICLLYHYKFHGKVIKDTFIQSLLSVRLRKDINYHVCRKLISNVSLFTDLSAAEVRDLVDMLVPEIFLPRDTIIYSGSVGKSMYFLCSGTVAVYTHSGREVCHLQDGAFFGEIALVFKDHVRSATIVAIEITEVYRLSQRDFEKTLFKNSRVLEKIQKKAIERLNQTRQLEDFYKRKLFEQSYGVSANETQNN